MLFCRDFCGILIENIGENVVKWKLTARFLNVYGTKCIKVNDIELIKYSKKGCLKIVKWLWSKGVDVTTVNNYAVCLASSNGHLDVVKFLVSKGADVTDENNYAIFCARKNGHLDVVKFLVSKGAKLE